MWISRKHYNFLMENAEKNINAECEILRAKDELTKSTARAWTEYSNTLTELDNLKKECTELERDWTRVSTERDQLSKEVEELHKIINKLKNEQLLELPTMGGFHD